jgi:hypothetical protein
MPTDPAKPATDYTILAEDHAAGYWHQLGTTRARSSDAAIRQHFAGTQNPGYEKVVAIPARSFQPVTLQVETQTVIKLQPATSEPAT